MILYPQALFKRRNIPFDLVWPNGSNAAAGMCIKYSNGYPTTSYWVSQLISSTTTIMS